MTRTTSTRLRWGPALAGAFWLATSGTAHAYIDPGSGSYIIQLLIGGVLGAGLAIRIFWGRIVSFFRRGSSSDGSAAAPPSTDDS